MKANSFIADYRFLKRMSEGLVGLTSSHGRQIFHTTELRKSKPCALCKVELKPGDTAYSPITNGYNRMHRLCVACVEELEHSK